MIWTWDVIRRIIEVLWLINIAFAIWTVFRSRRNIASTWAWLLVLSVFPYIGFILYLFLRRHLSHDKIFAIQDEQKKIRDQFLSKQRDELRKHDLLPEKDRTPRARRLVELNLNNDDAILTYNNQFEVFTDGPTLFDNLVENINQAKEMIDVEFYTFYDDHLGNRVLAALEAAQKRGVKVRVILRCQWFTRHQAFFFQQIARFRRTSTTLYFYFQ